MKIREVSRQAELEYRTKLKPEPAKGDQTFTMSSSKPAG